MYHDLMYQNSNYPLKSLYWIILVNIRLRSRRSRLRGAKARSTMMAISLGPALGK